MTTLKEQFMNRLGTVPDRVIAEEAGVSLQTVFTARNKSSIKPFHKHVDIPLKKLTEKNFASLCSELGKSRDSVLGRKYEVSREYVRQLRVRFNIPKFSQFVSK
jgi:hypothetical protein